MFKRFLVTVMMVGLLTQSLYANSHTYELKQSVTKLNHAHKDECIVNEFVLGVAGVLATSALGVLMIGLVGNSHLINPIQLRMYVAKIFLVSGAVAVYNAMQCYITQEKIKALTAVEDELFRMMCHA